MDPLPNNMDEVLPGLFLGNLAAAESLAILKTYSITHVLSLTHSLPVVPEEAGVIHRHVPILDVPTQNILSVIDTCLDFITEALCGEGNNILVHCYLGKSRSGGVVVAYVMKKQNIPLALAHTFVKSKRPLVHPNRAFRSQLELWGTSGYDSTILDDYEIVDFGFGDELPVVHKKRSSKSSSKRHDRDGTADKASVLDSQALICELGAAAGEEVRVREGWGIVHMDKVTMARFERCLDEAGIVREDTGRPCWAG
ncbi:protein-tyrosine phosphatase-like protein [Tuber borchii]|uniref:protein-tyrosine-phosphatase n=1 Tax=Tuber borchii TaxID=42251 RepID=A0A2T6ZMQ4_TUBBO|nr:protein-tyrosine phosphatase-like protein [Tuber borchii]